MRLALPALLLAGCAGQQVPIPSFPDTGVEFGGPSVSIGRPTMVSCPHTRPDGSYATFETTAELCNQLLLSSGAGAVNSPSDGQPDGSPVAAAPLSPPVGPGTASARLADDPQPDRVEMPFETAGGVCSLGKDRVVDTAYCDDLLAAQTRARGILGHRWERLSDNRQSIFSIWCYWSECLWHDRMAENIDGGLWLELGGLLMAMMGDGAASQDKDAIGVSMLRDDLVFADPISPRL